MRWLPRGMKGRPGLAVAVSLALHAAIVIAAIQAVSAIRGTSKADDTVDRRIGQPVDYSPIALYFDELPPPSTPAPLKKASPPTVSKEPPAPTTKAVTDAGHGSTGNTAATQPPAAAGNGNGPPAVAPLHGKIAKARYSVVYVLDRSGSMGRDEKLAHAVAVLNASLKQLAPEVRFQIVIYDSRAEVLRIGNSLDLVAATPEHVADAEAQLLALNGEGSSRHLEGLRAGFGLQPDLLILLTDADELSSKEVQQVKKWNTRGAAIHAVLIGATTESAASLQDLAGPQHVHFISAR